MRDNNNSEYRHIKTSRPSQAIVLGNVVAFQSRYHISKSTESKIMRDDLFQQGQLLSSSIKGSAWVSSRREMKGQKGMPVDVLVAKAIAGIEAGKTEIRPGLSDVLYLMSRFAPSLPFGKMAKMVHATS
jgi:hypothetical protein